MPREYGVSFVRKGGVSSLWFSDRDFVIDHTCDDNQALLVEHLLGK